MKKLNNEQIFGIIMGIFLVLAIIVTYFFVPGGKDLILNWPIL